MVKYGEVYGIRGPVSWETTVVSIMLNAIEYLVNKDSVQEEGIYHPHFQFVHCFHDIYTAHFW